MEWIDAKKKKPASNEEVLGVVSEEDARVIDIVIYDGRENCWVQAIDQIEEVTVTHWMPLPDMPPEA